MDRDKAKFILASFRACGADAEDPAFKEALELAVKDQELAEWLVEERAFDAKFTKCVTSLEVPEELRLQLTELLDPVIEENSEEELQVIGALATIQPPASLKSEILNAMNVTAQNQPTLSPVKKPSGGFSRSWFPLAVAAVVAIAAVLGFLTQGGTSSSSNKSLATIYYEALDYVQVDEISHDHKADSYLQTVSWAESNRVPTMQVLPSGLVNHKPLGAKKIRLGGYDASLVSFTSDNKSEMFHLITLEPNEMKEYKEILPTIDEVKKHCHKCPKSGYTVVKWQDGKQLHYLFSKSTPVEEFQEVF